MQPSHASVGTVKLMKLMMLTLLIYYEVIIQELNNLIKANY
jgi:hypothetical protein